MENKQKKSKIYKTIISSPNNIKPVSPNPVGNAYDNASCVYDHQWHAQGSKFESQSGAMMYCDSDGEWKNLRQKIVPNNKDK